MIIMRFFAFKSQIWHGKERKEKNSRVLRQEGRIKYSQYAVTNRKKEMLQQDHTHLFHLEKYEYEVESQPP